MLRKYYVCGHCEWEVEYGRVVWGLVELESMPRDLSTGLCLNEAIFEGADDRKLCPVCGTPLNLTLHQTRNDGTLQVMGAEYKTPIHSDSLAISPDQVAEHKKKFPNIEIDDQCRPVFTHQKTHQKYMDKCGIRKQTQKIGRGKGKIYSYPGSKCS